MKKLIAEVLDMIQEGRESLKGVTLKEHLSVIGLGILMTIFIIPYMLCLYALVFWDFIQSLRGNR